MPLTVFSDLTRNLRVARISTWISYVALIISLFGDGLLSGTAPALLIIAVLPLLIFLPGLGRENHRSITMLCFVCLLYFTVIVANLYEPDKTLFGVLALISVVSLFVAGMMFSRWLQAENRRNIVNNVDNTIVKTTDKNVDKNLEKGE